MREIQARNTLTSARLLLTHATATTSHFKITSLKVYVSLFRYHNHDWMHIFYRFFHCCP